MPTRVSVAAERDRKLLTAEEFLDWLVPKRFADLISGEICMHSPVSIRHADLLNFVHVLMANYVERHRLGVLYREVVAVRLSSRDVFMPDLAFCRADRPGRLRESHIDGAPDLVVEALSPRTAKRDTGPKFAAYEQHGVSEYWVLDPVTLAHRFYRHDGEFLVEYGADAARIESEVVAGFFVLREWLDPRDTPSVASAMARIHG